eukprot:s578_g1.t2
MAPPSCTTIGAAVEAAGCGGAIIDQAAGQVLYLGIGRHRGHGLAIDLVKTAEATLSRSGAHDLQNRATGRSLTQLTQRLEADSRGEEPPAKCHRFVCKQTGCCTLRSACGASCAGAPRGVLSSTAEEEWNLEDRLKDFDNLDGATGSDSQYDDAVPLYHRRPKLGRGIHSLERDFDLGSSIYVPVFCNTAIENAKADKDSSDAFYAQRHHALESTCSFLVQSMNEALRAVFNDIDVNQSKLVNLSELKVAMDQSKLSSFMESMDISTRDIWTLFMLIDSDESGEISIDEFVAGCMQLQGPAKSIQLARLRHEHHLVRRDLRLILDDIAALKTSMSPSSAERKKK